MSNREYTYSVERKGTWPVLRYAIYRHWEGRSEVMGVVMIDDDWGNIFINPMNQIAFMHFWGKQGRATDTLRSFLTKTDKGYLKDKFSYGLSRWTPEEAMKSLTEMLEEEIGGQHTWSEDIAEEFEEMEGAGVRTSDGWYMLLQDKEEIQKVIEGHDYPPSGECAANPEVERFIENVWPHLVACWEEELIAEGRMIKLTIEVPHAT